MRSQQSEVGVKLGRGRMIIAGAEVRVRTQTRPFAADHQRQLGVGLQADDAVHDLRAGALEPVRPVDIRFFVEARHQFHDDGDFLAVLGCFNQGFHQVGIHAGAIDRLLYCNRAGIARGSTNKFDDRLKRLKRVVQ